MQRKTRDYWNKTRDLYWLYTKPMLQSHVNVTVLMQVDWLQYIFNKAKSVKKTQFKNQPTRMDVHSPNRLSGHCRTRDDTELAKWRKGPFSWNDKYLEEYKQRAETLLGECLSFVFVTLCDTDSQHHSPRCVVMCTCAWIVCKFVFVCMSTSVHIDTHKPNFLRLTPPLLLHLNRCASGLC